MPKTPLRHLRQFIAISGVLIAAGCAAPPPAPLPPQPQPQPQANAQTQAMKQYAEAVIGAIRADQRVQQILAANQITQTLGVGLIIDPNGYVEKGFVRKSGINAVAEQALINHLVYVNFGAFTPDMPNHRLIFMVPVHPLPGAVTTAPEVPPYQMRRLVLYQPNSVLMARVGSAPPLAFYVQQLSATMNALISALPPGAGAHAALVVGVKPGGAVRAWIVDKDTNLPADLQARIITTMQAVPPVPVQGGPIALALIFNVWGGSAEPGADGANPPIPDEWHCGTPGTAAVPDGVFQQIWP